LIDEYRTGLAAAGLAEVDIIDSRADLNAYALVDGQSACCSPSDADSAACQTSGTSIHAGLAELMQRYAVNDYAASVKVFALKPAF
jgi:hypothetical protein